MTEQAVADWPYGDMADVRVGWWFAVCCEYDLSQITSEDELAEVRADFDDDREGGELGNWWHFFPTEEAGLAYYAEHG